MPDTSTASVEVASPSEAVASAATSEAVQTEQNPSIDPQGGQPEGDSQSPSPEFPDDAVFQALPGHEQKSNWQQLRAAYTSAKSDATAYQQYKTQLEQIDQMGGLERMQQQAELGGLLFSQVENPETGQIEFSTQPFVERLANESPDTLRDVVWQGIHGPNPYNPGETIGHAFLRDYLGINPDPQMLKFYAQFQTPQDVNKFLAQSGQVTAADMADIPEQFHEAYKSLTPSQREEYNLFSNDAVKAEFLQDKADALQARQFMAEQKQLQEQQRQQETQAFNQRVEARGTELAQTTANTLLDSVREKLKNEASFSSVDGVNDALHGEIVQWAAQKVLSDSAMKADSERAESLYTLSARAELMGDKFKAQEFKLQADNLARKLEGRFRATVVERSAFWSQALGVSRQATQQQLQTARPRPEIAGSNNAQSSPAAASSGAQRRDGFGFTPQQIEQYAQMARARQMGG